MGQDVPSVNLEPRLLDLQYVSVVHNVVICINLTVLHNLQELADVGLSAH